MRRKKILWITFWMTMVYWLGGAIGCATDGNDENYKILEDNDSSQIHDSFSNHPPTPNLPHTHTTIDTTTDQPTTDPAALPNALLANTSTPTTAPSPPSTHTPTPPATTPIIHAPSLTHGMDRSHWPKIQVGPADGRVAHGPIYFRDLPIHDNLQRPVSTMPFGQRIAAALDGDMAAGYDSNNLFATFAQPGKFVVDGLLLPIYAVFQPPFLPTTTPE